MKVKIIKANYPTYWYANHVGNILEVRDYESDFGTDKIEMKKCYAVIEGISTNRIRIIDLDDCEII
jgi:hypothetical protein